jgi:glycine dehydrogenase subunit 1
MRTLPLNDPDRAAMLAAIGVPSVEALYADVPAQALLDQPIEGLPAGRDEIAVERVFRDYARRNFSPAALPCFLGAGSYRHYVPAAVDHLIQRGEFLTTYTPYQPEIAQGTLQALFEFQTQVALLTGMEVANASMYDGATACAEAVLMARRLTRRDRVVLSGGLHPHYRDVTRTYGRFLGLDVACLPADWQGGEDAAAAIDGATACVVVQYPDLFGRIGDLEPLAAACHAAGALLVVAVTEIISLGAIVPPGEMGADIVAAEGQSLGNPPSFGGPTVGLFATRERFVRQMPGRLAGATRDADGRPGFVLTLATREQHIRREKATSNICTNAGLCALAFSIHLTLLGEQGFRHLAALNHGRACMLAERLAAIDGVELLNAAFFNEFTLRLPRPAAAVVDAMARRGVLGGVPASRLDPADPALEPLLLVAATELNGEADMDALATALREAIAHG